MTFLTSNSCTGIVINKIQYKDYHEILNIIDDKGIVSSYFYENINKNKKKTKVSVPNKVNVVYIQTSGMRKIISLDVIEYYKNISYDLFLLSDINYILEMISYDVDIHGYYLLLSNILDLIEYEDIDSKLALLFFTVKFLELNGHSFRYKTTDNRYLGYSFKKHMFLDYIEKYHFFEMDNKLVKLIYLLRISDYNILTKIYLDKEEYRKLFIFINLVLNNYIGIYLKAYNKIIELEDYDNDFRGDNKI
ncbi:hypothetical protein [Gemelliphila palaticanis]|uniref:DNA repair protein RecO n=1 Tax=Gemelliphila palaticanis TaxID=81950 RepID=A0ABX2SY32_9BACL|nr:hypothetical protein [Gemella palaticanis]MBF0715281.1 hypothetical protein [Gemella palaticanis]NYS47211.1 hypothetical protein [Gemella palaticanis]